MKTIQTILEKFERKFEYGMCERENVKTFIAAAFDEYKKELREAVEGMKKNDKENPEGCDCYGKQECECWRLAVGNNKAFDSVLELLK